MDELNAGNPVEPVEPTESAAPADTAEQAPDLEYDGQTGDLEQAPSSEAARSEATPEGELVDVEYEGRKYRVHPDLRDGVLRYGDYTRKTQALAEDRRTFDGQANEVRQQIAQQYQQAQNLSQDYQALGSWNYQVDALRQHHQNAMAQGDAMGAQTIWQQLQMAEHQRNLANQALQEKLNLTSQQAKAALEQQQRAQSEATAKRVEEGQRQLQREIPGWSEDYAGKLSTFAQNDFGFRPEELQAVDDPRMIKVLHLAYLGQQSLQKQAAGSKAATAQAARPAQQVGSTAAAPRARTTDSSGDKLSTADWQKAEAARMARRAEASRKSRFVRAG
jgi:hypothetical protein